MAECETPLSVSPACGPGLDRRNVSRETLRREIVVTRPVKFAGRHRQGYSADDRWAWIRSLVENLFGGRPTASPPDLAALRRPLPAGIAHDVAFARPLLEAYADAPATTESDCAWSVFGHYRLAAIASARAAQADPATAEFDLLVGAALRHVAESVWQAGRWLAEAFDLRLSPRVRPDPGGRELTGRLMFLDPALGSALQERRIWLGDIAGIGRRVAQSPVTFREGGSDLVPGPIGRAPVAEALRGHLEELDGFLRAVVAAIERYSAAGGRPREEPDEAWLND